MNKIQETETIGIIKAHFEKLTRTSVSVNIIPAGKKHEPTPLKANHCGVYAFGIGATFFKVGKVGPKSKARWTTHHYKHTQTTRSTLAKSIVVHKEILKNHNLLKKTQEIDAISDENIARWIKDNMFRIEFVFEFNENPFALNLLEGRGKKFSVKFRIGLGQLGSC